MVQIGQFMLGLTQNVSLLALLIVGYVWIRRVPHMSRPMRDSAVGLLFGVGAVAAMLTSVDIGSGLLLDGRTIMIGLAPVFGGWIAVLLTDAIAIGFRVWVGGPVHAPWLGMVIASLLGIGFWRLHVRRGIRPRLATFWLLGLLISAANLALLLLRGLVPSPIPLEGLLEMLAAPLLLVNPLAMAILGIALQREDDRLALQRRLDEQSGLFEAIFGAMSDGVTVANAEGEIVMANPKSQELAGAAPGATPSSDWASAFRIHQVDRDALFPEAEMPLLKAA